jgi:hypothetical protein
MRLDVVEELSMNVELTREKVETLLESLQYSKRSVADAQGTAYGVRQQNLGRLDAVDKKLREARKLEKQTTKG